MMLRSARHIALAALLALLGAAGQSDADTIHLQRSLDGEIRPLTLDVFNELGDPLFELLLKDKAEIINFGELCRAIQPNTSKHHLFIVSEEVVDSKRGPRSSRRAVLAFSGRNAGQDLQGNVMFSFSIGSESVPERLRQIEAWGWDEERQRYNYYILNARGRSIEGPEQVWKFVASSVGASELTAQQRGNNCLACHVTGAPIMKELFFPWNNWHAGVGGSFSADYLLSNTPGEAEKWPVASSNLLATLGGADRLETDFIIPSLRRFAKTLIDETLLPIADEPVEGSRTVADGKRLLRPLFETREINMISSRQTTGKHVFSADSDFIPAKRFPFPASFFVNADLIAGGGSGGMMGLGITDARQFGSLPGPTQAENFALMQVFNMRMNNRLNDTHFGWFTPEPGFIDNLQLDEAMKQGAISPHFLAAALAVDLENPVFSAKRASLLDLVPAEYRFTPLAAGTAPTPGRQDTDLLTAAVIKNLEENPPALGTAHADFLTLLKSDNAVIELEVRVKALREATNSKLASSDAGVRDAELKRLYKLLIQRREHMLEDPILRTLRESPLLFPMPSN